MEAVRLQTNMGVGQFECETKGESEEDSPAASEFRNQALTKIDQTLAPSGPWQYMKQHLRRHRSSTNQTNSCGEIAYGEAQCLKPVHLVLIIIISSTSLRVRVFLCLFEVQDLVAGDTPAAKHRHRRGCESQTSVTIVPRVVCFCDATLRELTSAPEG